MGIEKTDLSSLVDKLPKRIDIFICCASFEDRCLSIAKSINKEDVGAALIAKNMDLPVHLDTNANALKDLFGTTSVHVPVSTNNPIQTADELKNALTLCSEGTRKTYLIDITTFTHEHLLILLKVLPLAIGSQNQVIFGYSSASDYDVDSPVKDKWLTKGVGEIRSVLGYPGLMLPSGKSHLIILVGFEHERASELIRVFEPSAISLGHDKEGSSTSPTHYAAHLHFLELIREVAAKHSCVFDFEFACNDPWLVQKAIIDQVSAMAEYNTILAPMNTKIATAGCALASLQNDKIQLCYAQAIHYNYAAYSTPGSHCYLFETPELFA